MAEITEEGKQNSNPEDFMVDGQVRNFSLNDEEAAPSAPALSLD
jgi:t-SNARE complex subunit (syntaxin)